MSHSVLHRLARAVSRTGARHRFAIVPLFLSATAFFCGLTPSQALACACGCGVFEVGTSSMFPTEAGGMVFLEYDYMDQYKNWSGDDRAPSANNSDKEIRTHFMTAGLQYMFSRSWGLQVEVPVWNRYFKTTDPDTGNIVSFDHTDLSDIRVKGIYTGFSPDLSTGITFGLKLPTGNYTYPNFDRDTEIGTGSTDILLGAFHRGNLTSDNNWSWFVQGQSDLPVLRRDSYRPGVEFDAAAGVHYNGWSFGADSQITPLLQVIGSYRFRDTGLAADTADSGYARVLLSPGLAYNVGHVRVYGDVEFPVFAHVNGNQLVAPALFKVIVGYVF